MDLITGYKNLTDAIVVFAGCSRPMIHMHAGMAIYLAMQLVLGTRRGSLPALMTVLVCELGNETVERLYYGSWRWPDTRADIVITLFWPTLCYAVSSARRWRWYTRLARAERPVRWGRAVVVS